MSLLRKIFVIMLVFSVAACGFKPVYKDGEGGVGAFTELRTVKIGKVIASNKNREGITVLKRHVQVLKSKLEDLLNPKNKISTHKYILDIIISKRRDAQSIEQNRAITRRNITVTAAYTLKEIESSVVVNRGRSIMVSSFDVVDSDFANFSAEEDALVRTIKAAASDIRFKVVGFLTNPDKDKIIREIKDKIKGPKDKGEDSSGES